MTTTILFADRPSPWRDAISDGIAKDEECVVEVTDDGDALLEALVERPSSRGTIVVGDELQCVGGMEALYLASRRLEASKKEGGDASASSVILITSVRTDVEWLDLMRKRGVDNFVYRDDPIEATIALVLRTPVQERRVHPRLRVAIGVDLSFEDGTAATGVLENVSVGGMQISVASGELKKRSFATGMPVGLTFATEQVGSSVSCRSEVRRVTLRKRLLGDRLVLGLRLIDLDDPTRDAVKKLLSGVARPSMLPF